MVADRTNETDCNSEINYGPFYVSITGARRARIRFRRKFRHKHSAAPRAGVKHKSLQNLTTVGRTRQQFLNAKFQSLTTDLNSMRPTPQQKLQIRLLA